MSDEAKPIKGEVKDPAEVCRVRIGDYDGRGAIRVYPTKIEVAYLGPSPKRVPCPIEIDGTPMTATAIVNTRNAATAIVLVTPLVD